VAEENIHSELVRLRRLQSDARYSEIFGGFSRAERYEYEARAKRIRDLEVEFQLGEVAAHSGVSAAAEQRREWNKTSETDTPQNEARQSYRNREMESSNAFTDSLKTGRRNQPKSDSAKDRE
jgi:hypothetical protein